MKQRPQIITPERRVHAFAEQFRAATAGLNLLHAGPAIRIVSAEIIRATKFLPLQTNG